MKKTESILGAVAVVAIVYKLILGNELNSALIISVTGLSLFYTYLSFAYFNKIRFLKIFKRSSYAGISKWRILGTIILGLGLALTTVGILWSLMSWPFNTFYSLGIPVLFIVGLISALKFNITKSKDYFIILKRVLIIGGFGFILWLTPRETLNAILGIDVVYHKQFETIDELVGRNYDYAHKVYFSTDPDIHYKVNINSDLNEFDGGILNEKDILTDSIVQVYTWDYPSHKKTIWVGETDRMKNQIIDAIWYSDDVQF